MVWPFPFLKNRWTGILLDTTICRKSLLPINTHTNTFNTSMILIIYILLHYIVHYIDLNQPIGHNLLDKFWKCSNGYYHRGNRWNQENILLIANWCLLITLQNKDMLLSLYFIFYYYSVKCSLPCDALIEKIWMLLSSKIFLLNL